jgi:mRNA-degrading endonuclease toxin of MazEF toxin-antitoxin module
VAARPQGQAGGGRGRLGRQLGNDVRPAVVEQCDRLNQQIRNTLLAMMTGNTRLLGREPTRFLIDPTAPEGASSSLAQPSAVKCENIATIPQQDIVDTIGQLSAMLKKELDTCLKAALELS